MKIREIVTEAGMETGEGNRKLAAIGRVLMDRAVTTKDDALSNLMSTFGPRSPQELMQKSGVSKEMMMKLLKFGEAELKKSGDVAKGADVPDEPEDDEKYSASDDEIDAKARAMAR